MLHHQITEKSSKSHVQWRTRCVSLSIVALIFSYAAERNEESGSKESNGI